MELPKSKYDIIYCDPPWRYQRHQYSSSANYAHRPENKYPTMSFEDLKLLPVNNICKDNSLLFMWVVSPLIKECIEVGESWLFKYITVAFVWYKHIPLQGHYTMPTCELCLVFRKGNIPKPRGERNIQQFISCKKSNHSSKPAEIRYRIHKMFPEQSKIELFARPSNIDNLQNWDYWGNELADQQVGIFDFEGQNGNNQ